MRGQALRFRNAGGTSAATAQRLLAGVSRAVVMSSRPADIADGDGSAA
jgi:hypothetical protein